MKHGNKKIKYFVVLTLVVLVIFGGAQVWKHMGTDAKINPGKPTVGVTP